MKNLTFALACASTFALFAEIEAPKADFEKYAEGDKVSGMIEPDRQFKYWLYEGASGSEDGSTVTAYAPAESDQNQKYLNLSTEGGTLWRSLAKVNTEGSGTLGDAQVVPAAGLYIDTMVQFTPTEDGEPPTTVEGDKLAIWLNVETGEGLETPVTNLCVRANAYTLGEAGPMAAATTFPLVPADGSALSINPGTWYRLTVKAVANALSTDKNGIIPAFEIRVDGALMKAASGQPFSEFFGDFVAEGLQAAYGQNALFPSLQEMGGQGASITLQAVGFKGSGALDNLSISEDDPLPAPGEMIGFTIKAPEGMEKVEWSTAVDGEFTAYVAGAQTSADKIYVKLTTADGGVKIVEQTVAASGANEFDLTSQTVDWSWYLGDADAGGAFIVDNETELEKLAEKAVSLGTDGVTFKLGANIALTKPWAGIGTTNSATDCFKGTFDGQGFKISNVVMKDNGAGKNHYRGFFNQIDGGTVKNLTVESFGFGTTPPSGEYGSAAIAGIANNATIENCVSEGTVASSTHNAGGIVVRIKDTTVKGCTNKANLTGNYTKIAGVVVLCMNSATACLIENCKNEGTLTAVGVDSIKTDDGKDFKAGSDGVAGIISYVGDGKLTIKDCSNTGALVKGANANSGAKLGQIIGWNHAGVKALEGTITGTTAARMICDMSTPATRHLATVADGVATLVEDSTIAAGGSYMAMATGCTITLANVNDSITIDTTLADVTVKTAAENAYVAQADNVYTVTAKADAEFTVSINPTEAEWTAELTLPIPTITGTDATGTWSPAEIAEPDAGKTNVYTYTVTVAATDTTKETTKSVEFKVYKNATVVYPEYITDDTTKGKFDTWANAYGITGDDRKTASMDAYLLNCAPASVAEEKAKFKIVSIEQNAETGAWTVKVTDENKVDGDPYGNGTIEIQGATKLEGPWAKDTPDAKFFKAILK